MVSDVIIVGGGTAGWVTAAYLAKRLNAASPAGVGVTLIESPDIGIIGVGEGSFPSIRKTLQAIGVSEADLVRECEATFKQGIRFADWRTAPQGATSQHYFHPFQNADEPEGLDLLPYWLLGVAGERGWDAVSSVQKSVADACLAPKLAEHPPYRGPLTYAYHFDAVALAALLRKTAEALGVKRIVDTVSAVSIGEDGAISGLRTAEHGELSAGLYVDCTGFRAELIGRALGVPFHSRRRELFANRAVALQVPYAAAEAPIASQTIATAKRAGWTWDIGLQTRRGTGYVYSSDHIGDDEAEAALRTHVGKAAEGISARLLSFEPGYRRTQWVKNCVAIGLSAGFIEPLEATGIGFAEIAAQMLVNLFPWRGDFDVSARQFNAIMEKRYDHVVDFIKLHYFLSDRRDSDFWNDNVAENSASPALLDRLERWRYRAPDFIDVDLNHDIFLASNWQYVLYGMGFRSDLSAQAGSYRFHQEAKAAFAGMAQQERVARTRLPPHRALTAQLTAQLPAQLAAQRAMPGAAVRP